MTKRFGYGLFPGVAFRGADWERRAWVIGTALDVWEIVEAFDDIGSVARMADGGRQPSGRYNVRAADDERQLDGLDDEQLLELAVEKSRVMVTFDVKDFTVLARRWARGRQKPRRAGDCRRHRSQRVRHDPDALTHELKARPKQSQCTEPHALHRPPRPRHIADEPHGRSRVVGLTPASPVGVTASVATSDGSASAASWFSPRLRRHSQSYVPGRGA